MKKLMFIGRTGAGKTSFRQALAGETLQYQKTQAIQFLDDTIDTPGEYVENRALYKALIVTSVQASCVLLFQSATDLQTSFAPGIASVFNRPVIGLVTKVDAADEAAIRKAHRMLEAAGCRKIFHVSNKDGSGIPEAAAFLQKL